MKGDLNNIFVILEINKMKHKQNTTLSETVLTSNRKKIVESCSWMML